MTKVLNPSPDRNTVTMDTKELAKKFIDEILYDNDYINRLSPLNEEKHYGSWPEKIATILEPIVSELGMGFFTDLFITSFTVGTQEDREEAIREHPCLSRLIEALEEYFEWLTENVD